jgi:hypothetical protein
VLGGAKHPQKVRLAPPEKFLLAPPSRKQKVTFGQNVFCYKATLNQSKLFYP